MRESGPGGLDWRGHGRSAVGLEGFDGRSEPAISEFYRGGVLIPPPPHGGTEVNFTMISLKVEVFSSTIMSAGISRYVLHIDELVGPYE